MQRSDTFKTVVIRHATADDDKALIRLAALDSAATPHGSVLVAEADGELVAAVGTGDGRSVADPFKPSRQFVDVLRALTS